MRMIPRPLLYFFLAVVISSCQAFLFGEAREKPNVLLIVIDDLNDWVGALGGHPLAQTPHIDSLVKSSLLFTNAQCAAPACQPSRYAVLSGLHPTSSGWYGNYFDDGIHNLDQRLNRVTHLPSFLQSYGYWTMGAGKVYHYGVQGNWSFNQWDEVMPEWTIPESWYARTPTRYSKLYRPFPSDGGRLWSELGIKEGYSLCGGPVERSDLPEGKFFDEMIADWAVERIKETRDRPFFLAAGFVRPHVPYTAPKAFFELYPLESIETANVPDNEFDDIPIYGKAMTVGLAPGGDHRTVERLGDDYRRELIQAYLASVSFVDAQVGTVIQALKDSDRWDDTIVVLFSDHGQNLGEKRNWRKMCLWEESVRVPLIIRVPGKKGMGHASNEAVSLLDLYPTFADLLNLEKPEHLDGESLVPLLDNPDTKRETPALTTWHFGNHSLRDERWRYTRYRDGTEELYDHQTDPDERVNLAKDPSFGVVIEILSDYLPKEVEPIVLPDRRNNDILDRVLREWDEKGVPEWLQ